jgi:predicted DNA-binding transcriptional regulator AlpA
MSSELSTRTVKQGTNLNPNVLKSGGAEHLWTVDDVSAYTGMSLSWIYHQAAAGTVPRIYIGSKLRFVAEEVRAWALSQRKMPRAPRVARKAEA